MKCQPAVIILLMLLVFSCKKETPRVTVSPKITNPTDYLLVSQTWTGPSSNGLSYILSYNDENLLSDAENIQWWGGSMANGDTTYLHFEYSNGLCIKVSINENANSGSVVYDYNSNGLPVRAVTYNSNVYFKTDRFEYDSSDRLVRLTDAYESVDQTNFIYEYSYDDLGNPTTLKVTDVPGKKIMKTEWPTFDNKINYIKSVNGLPPGCLFFDDYYSFFSPMPHNFLSENYNPYIDLGSSFGSPWTYQYQYKYNEQDLPTQMLSGPWIVTNVYKKYK
jgi:hypothetical protein